MNISMKNVLCLMALLAFLVSPVTSAPPTAAPSPRPTPEPSPRPTAASTVPPTVAPTPAPTVRPTPSPTSAKPTPAPSPVPTTAAPTARATTAKPTPNPTVEPSTRPTPTPTTPPTIVPTQPTFAPTKPPTGQPTGQPTGAPSTNPRSTFGWATMTNPTGYFQMIIYSSSYASCTGLSEMQYVPLGECVPPIVYYHQQLVKTNTGSFWMPNATTPLQNLFFRYTMAKNNSANTFNVKLGYYSDKKCTTQVAPLPFYKKFGYPPKFTNVSTSNVYVKMPGMKCIQGINDMMINYVSLAPPLANPSAPTPMPTAAATISAPPPLPDSSCKSAYCTSPDGKGGYDCWAGSVTEACTCSQGSARMTGYNVTDGKGHYWYEYTCCMTGVNVGNVCGKYGLPPPAPPSILPFPTAGVAMIAFSGDDKVAFSNCANYVYQTTGVKPAPTGNQFKGGSLMPPPPDAPPVVPGFTTFYPYQTCHPASSMPGNIINMLDDKYGLSNYPIQSFGFTGCDPVTGSYGLFIDVGSSTCSSPASTTVYPGTSNTCFMDELVNNQDSYNDFFQEFVIQCINTPAPAANVKPGTGYAHMTVYHAYDTTCSSSPLFEEYVPLGQCLPLLTPQGSPFYLPALPPSVVGASILPPNAKFAMQNNLPVPLFIKSLPPASLFSMQQPSNYTFQEALFFDSGCSTSQMLDPSFFATVSNTIGNDLIGIMNAAASNGALGSGTGVGAVAIPNPPPFNRYGPPPAGAQAGIYTAPIGVCTPAESGVTNFILNDVQPTGNAAESTNGPFGPSASFSSALFINFYPSYGHCLQDSNSELAPLPSSVVTHQFAFPLGECFMIDSAIIRYPWTFPGDPSKQQGQITPMSVLIYAISSFTNSNTSEPLVYLQFDYTTTTCFDLNPMTIITSSGCMTNVGLQGPGVQTSGSVMDESYAAYQFSYPDGNVQSGLVPSSGWLAFKSYSSMDGTCSGPAISEAIGLGACLPQTVCDDEDMLLMLSNGTISSGCMLTGMYTMLEVLGLQYNSTAELAEGIFYDSSCTDMYESYIKLPVPPTRIMACMEGNPALMEADIIFDTIYADPTQISFGPGILVQGFPDTAVVGSPLAIFDDQVGYAHAADHGFFPSPATHIKRYPFGACISDPFLYGNGSAIFMSCSEAGDGYPSSIEFAAYPLSLDCTGPRVMNPTYLNVTSHFGANMMDPNSVNNNGDSNILDLFFYPISNPSPNPDFAVWLMSCANTSAPYPTMPSMLASDVVAMGDNVLPGTVYSLIDQGGKLAYFDTQAYAWSYTGIVDSDMMPVPVMAEPPIPYTPAPMSSSTPQYSLVAMTYPSYDSLCAGTPISTVVYQPIFYCQPILSGTTVVRNMMRHYYLSGNSISCMARISNASDTTCSSPFPFFWEQCTDYGDNSGVDTHSALPNVLTPFAPFPQQYDLPMTNGKCKYEYVNSLYNNVYVQYRMLPNTEVSMQLSKAYMLETALYATFAECIADDPRLDFSGMSGTKAFADIRYFPSPGACSPSGISGAMSQIITCSSTNLILSLFSDSNCKSLMIAQTLAPEILCLPNKGPWGTQFQSYKCPAPYESPSYPYALVATTFSAPSCSGQMLSNAVYQTPNFCTADGPDSVSVYFLPDENNDIVCFTQNYVGSNTCSGEPTPPTQGCLGTEFPPTFEPYGPLPYSASSTMKDSTIPVKNGACYPNKPDVNGIVTYSEYKAFTMDFVSQVSLMIGSVEMRFYESQDLCMSDAPGTPNAPMSPFPGYPADARVFPSTGMCLPLPVLASSDAPSSVIYTCTRAGFQIQYYLDTACMVPVPGPPPQMLPLTQQCIPSPYGGDTQVVSVDCNAGTIGDPSAGHGYIANPPTFAPTPTAQLPTTAAPTVMNTPARTPATTPSSTSARTPANTPATTPARTPATTPATTPTSTSGLPNSAAPTTAAMLQTAYMVMTKYKPSDTTCAGVVAETVFATNYVCNKKPDGTSYMMLYSSPTATTGAMAMNSYTSSDCSGAIASTQSGGPNIALNTCMPGATNMYMKVSFSATPSSTAAVTGTGTGGLIRYKYRSLSDCTAGTAFTSKSFENAGVCVGLGVAVDGTSAVGESFGTCSTSTNTFAYTAYTDLACANKITAKSTTNTPLLNCAATNNVNYDPSDLYEKWVCA